MAGMGESEIVAYLQNHLLMAPTANDDELIQKVHQRLGNRTFPEMALMLTLAMPEIPNVLTPLLNL